MSDGLQPWDEFLDDPRNAHLRDDAPFRVCSGCGRKSFGDVGTSADEGARCKMPQPDGSVCDGTFGRLEMRVASIVETFGGPPIEGITQVEPDDPEKRAVALRKLDEAHADAMAALREQGVRGQFLLFVPIIVEGQPGVRMLGGGQETEEVDAETMMAGVYRHVLDLIDAMGMTHLL